jgi:hypothetical protein
MKRSAPLKRTGWPRRAQPEPGTAPARVKPVAKPLERPVRYAVPANDALFSAPKEVQGKPGKGAPNAEEREWMDWIVAYGCIACHIDGLGQTPPAVHHILRGGQRIGHLFTIPLCDPGHHQGGQERGMVSRHPWKARFEARYGSEMELLESLRFRRQKW